MRNLVRVIDGTLTTYGYDARGNRVKENGNQQWAYDSANVLTHIGGRGVSHDPRGNMTTKPIDTSSAWNMTYDAENHLLELKEDGVTKLTNEYDAFGRRVRKFEDGRETVIMYQGVHVIYEWEADQGTWANPTNTWYLMIGNRRVAQIVDGVRQYLTTDHLGSVRGLDCLRRLCAY